MRDFNGTSNRECRQRKYISGDSYCWEYGEVRLSTVVIYLQSYNNTRIGDTEPTSVV